MNELNKLLHEKFSHNGDLLWKEEILLKIIKPSIKMLEEKKNISQHEIYRQYLNLKFNKYDSSYLAYSILENIGVIEEVPTMKNILILLLREINMTKKFPNKKFKKGENYEMIKKMLEEGEGES